MFRRVLLMLTLAAGAAACNSSMTTPSTAGATITGSVSASSPSESFTESEPASGPSDDSTADSAGAGSAPVTTVTIQGSLVQTTVDANGNFTLTGVPSGNIKLRFRGTGVDSIVIVPSVEGGQTITIVVTITGGTAALDADDRSLTAGGLLQLEGRIDAIPPVTLADTFILNGQTVVTNASTVFTDHGSNTTFAALAVGVRVHVAGTASGDTLVASKVMIQNTNATLPISINGNVQGFIGTALSFSFTVNGTLVNGDTTTTFKGNSAFADLANGKRVEVKALQGNGFVTATSIHVNKN